MLTFITGASSGIGAACAQAFAAAGHDLILIARRIDRLTEIQQKIQLKHEVSIHTFCLDIRNKIKIEELFRKHNELFENVEILINNAGLAIGLSPIQEGKPENWDTVIDTNIKGLLYVTRNFLPQMISHRRGHIVNVGSVAGHWVYEKGAVYCASKYAVRAITEGLRLDVKGTGVRITEISPGMVETEFSEVRFGNKEWGDEVYRGRKPLAASDIAETILWCTQRPAHVNIQELIIYPTEQAGVHSLPK